MPYFPFRCGPTGSQRSGPTAHLTAGSGSHGESELGKSTSRCPFRGRPLPTSTAHLQDFPTWDFEVGECRSRVTSAAVVGCEQGPGYVKLCGGIMSSNTSCIAAAVNLIPLSRRQQVEGANRSTRAPLREERDVVSRHSEQHDDACCCSPTPTFLRCERGSEACESEANVVYRVGCDAFHPPRWVKSAYSMVLELYVCLSAWMRLLELVDVGRILEGRTCSYTDP